MNYDANFDVEGLIGKIAKVGTALKVSIASKRPTKGKNNEWNDNTTWCTITVFQNTAEWVEQNCEPGDFVRAKGRIADSQYEKNGETQYSNNDLLVDSFDRKFTKAQLAKKD